MRRFTILFLLACTLLACNEKDKPQQAYPEDGKAFLDIRGRPYQFKYLESYSVSSMSIIGVLDNRDDMDIFFKNMIMDTVGKQMLTKKDITVWLFDDDAIHGEYDLIEDAFSDFLTLDSIIEKRNFYSMQANVVDSFSNSGPDTLWITGTMYVDRP